MAGDPDGAADHDTTPDVALVHEMDGDAGVPGSVGVVESSVAADKLSPYTVTPVTLNV